MADVINLRRARKTRARDQAATQAAQNRASYGRKPSERAAADADKARHVRTLDSAKLDR
jgi:hypothetical protein